MTSLMAGDIEVLELLWPHASQRLAILFPIGEARLNGKHSQYVLTLDDASVAA